MEPMYGQLVQTGMMKLTQGRLTKLTTSSISSSISSGLIQLPASIQTAFGILNMSNVFANVDCQQQFKYVITNQSIEGSYNSEPQVPSETKLVNATHIVVTQKQVQKTFVFTAQYAEKMVYYCQSLNKQDLFINYSFNAEEGVLQNGNTITYKDQELTFMAQSESDFVSQYMGESGEGYLETLNYTMYQDLESLVNSRLEKSRELASTLPIQFEGKGTIRYGQADGGNSVCNLRDMPQLLLSQQNFESYNGNTVITVRQKCDYCGIIVEFRGLALQGLSITASNAAFFNVQYKLNGSSEYRQLVQNNPTTCMPVGTNKAFAVHLEPQYYDSLLITASRGSLYDSPQISVQGAAVSGVSNNTYFYQQQFDTISPYQRCLLVGQQCQYNVGSFAYLTRTVKIAANTLKLNVQYLPLQSVIKVIANTPEVFMWSTPPCIKQQYLVNGSNVVQQSSSCINTSFTICFNDLKQTRLSVINARAQVYTNTSIEITANYSSTPLDINNADGNNVYDNLPSCWSTFLSPMWDITYCNKVTGGFKRAVEVFTLLTIVVVIILLAVAIGKCVQRNKLQSSVNTLLLKSHQPSVIPVEVSQILVVYALCIDNLNYKILDQFCKRSLQSNVKQIAQRFMQTQSLDISSQDLIVACWQMMVEKLQATTVTQIQAIGKLLQGLNVGLTTLQEKGELDLTFEGERLGQKPLVDLLCFFKKQKSLDVDAYIVAAGTVHETSEAIDKDQDIDQFTIV